MGNAELTTGCRARVLASAPTNGASSCEAPSTQTADAGSPSGAGGLGHRLRVGLIRFRSDQLNRKHVLDGQRSAAATAEREAGSAGVDHLLTVETKEASHALDCTWFAGGLVWVKTPFELVVLSEDRSGWRGSTCGLGPSMRAPLLSGRRPAPRPHARATCPRSRRPASRRAGGADGREEESERAASDGRPPPPGPSSGHPLRRRSHALGDGVHSDVAAPLAQRVVDLPAVVI